MTRRAVLLVSVLLVIVAARPAWADHNDPPMTFSRSPAEGPPGSVIEVSGTGCIYHGKPYQRAVVEAYRTTANGDDVRFQFSEALPVAADGSFGGSLPLPTDTPLGVYMVDATCYADDMAFGVGDAPFTVTAPPPPTTQPPPTTVTTASPPRPSTTVPSTSTSAPTSTTMPPASSSSTGSTELAGASSPSTSVPDDDDGGGGLPLMPVVGAFAALAVAGGGIARRHRIREAVRGPRGG